MSYARWSEDSDVYVFACVSGHLECCGCALEPSHTFVAHTTAKMLAHLDAHKAARHDVPDSCVERLKEEAVGLDLWIAEVLTDDHPTTQAREEMRAQLSEERS